MSHEILINATMVADDMSAKIYEFVLNEELKVLEAVHIQSLADGLIAPVKDFGSSLKGDLFELNHVRVNPRVDNTTIVGILTQALEEIGVNVGGSPRQDDLKVTFKPLGEISDNVRFYFHSDGKVVFLSPAVKPKLVAMPETMAIKRYT